MDDSDDDIVLNVTASRDKKNDPSFLKRLPEKLPDGRRVDPNNLNLRRKLLKTHAPANYNSNVFVPKHKLPVLDEFGFNGSSRPPPKPKKSAAEKTASTAASKPPSKRNPKERKEAAEKKEVDPKIIPKEVIEVAGGLPPSFPKHRVKKFTEEYQARKRLREEQPDEEPSKKRRTSYVKGPNPRKREKAPNLFVEETLSDLHDLHPYLAKNLEENFHIKNLTKIQNLSLPPLLHTRLSLDKKEFIINSGVGTGKILTLVIPVVNNLALLEPKITRDDGIFALVLLPTRELAADVSDVFVKLCRTFTRIVPGLLTGGERKKSEKARLRKGLNILITTPGRLIDHIEHSMNLDFRKLKYCMIGEAHRLLDPMREETSKQIALVLRKKLPKDCVRCAATSTLTTKLKKFLEIFLHNPEIIDGFKEFED